MNFPRTTLYIFVVSLLLLPLFIIPSVAISFDEIYLIPRIWLIYGILTPLSIFIIAKNFRIITEDRLIFGFIILWIVLICMTTIINNGTRMAWLGAPDRGDGAIMHICYVLFLASGLIIAKKERLEHFLKFLSYFAVLLAVTNILQQLRILGVIGEGAVSGVAATLYGGTLGNRGYMGGALTLVLPLVIWQAKKSPSWWSLGAVMLVTCAWFGSFTRGAWLAGLLALLLLLIYRMLTPKIWLGLALGILCCVGLAFINGETRLLSWSRDAQAEGIADNSGRTVLWTSASIGIAQRPLTGWSSPALWRVMSTRADTDLLSESNVTDVKFIRRLSSKPTEPVRLWVEHSGGSTSRISFSVNKVHNEFLDYGLTYGVLVLAVFLILFGRAIFCSAHNFPALSAALAGYMVYLMTWPEVIRFAPVAWFFAGLALASTRVNQKERV